MADKKVNRIEITLANGLKLVAEQNTDSKYSREMFIGIEDATGTWLQDLAIVRSSYHYDGNDVIWSDEQFDVLVYGCENNEDYTDEFSIGLHQEETE